MTREERHMIDVMEKARADKTAQLRTAYNDGLAEGEATTKAAIITAAVARGESDEVIAQWTGLPAEEIARLRAGL
jgi:hypothetical protein